ncbi:MAG TPA: hypothetical protein VND54_12615 [Candidatus Saccharimonadales bacterium]|nr:hypothetical protein [Candidatus Saccharimonadales bacterium]
MLEVSVGELRVGYGQARLLDVDLTVLAEEEDVGVGDARTPSIRRTPACGDLRGAAMVQPPVRLPGSRAPQTDHLVVKVALRRHADRSGEDFR